MPLFIDYPTLAFTTGLVVVILTLTATVYLILRKRKPSEGLSKIGSRIWSWWILAGVFILALIFDRNFMLLFLAFVSYLALKEYLSIVPTRRADRRILFLAYLGIPFQYFIIWQNWYLLFLVFIPSFIFIIIPLGMVLSGEAQGFLRAHGTLTWGMMAAVFSLGHLAYLLVLPDAANPIAGGAGLFLFVVALTLLNDVAHFTLGKALGGPRLVPQVSTTRSWAGLVGGIIFTAVIAWLVAPLLTPFTAVEAIGAGVLISLGGVVGYLIFSGIKGDLQLKDRGTMVMGRGGVLNRIDSLIFTSPLFFHFVFYVYATGV